MKKKVFCLFCIILLCAEALFGCGRRDVGRLQRVDTAMGTVIAQQIYMTEPDRTVADAVLAQIDMLESQTLSWRVEGSELARLNGSAGDARGMPLSVRMEEYLRDCLEVSAASDGAFDISIGMVAGLWDIDGWAAGGENEGYLLPEAELLQETLALAGYEKLDLKEHRLYLPKGVRLDLGAVGKGIALDEILSMLREDGRISGAVISVGGSILTYGEKPDGSAWSVGIADPSDPSRMIGVLSLTGQWCVSTSGDYERFVEVDGVRYHHILDPATGYPAKSGLSSVTILTKDGFLSDALSTACFVLGKERGMELAEQFDAEALFVDGQGEIAMTEGMEAFFRQ